MEIFRRNKFRPERRVLSKLSFNLLTGIVGLATLGVVHASAQAAEADEPIESESTYADETEGEIPEDSPFRPGRFSVNYFAILFGPSVKYPTAYQPDLGGNPDAD